MSEESRVQKLAQSIADELFINGRGQHAHRLVLEGVDKRDLGGRCKQSVVDVIARHLDAEVSDAK